MSEKLYKLAFLHENPVMDGKISLGDNLQTEIFQGTAADLFGAVEDHFSVDQGCYIDLQFPEFEQKLIELEAKGWVLAIIVSPDGHEFRFGGLERSKE